MTSIRLSTIPYVPEGSRLFEAVAHWPWSVFLDSGPDGRRRGRYDIIAANPTSVLLTRGRLTEVRRERESVLSPTDPFQLLARELGPMAETPDFLPLAGGCLGYFAYDLAHRLEQLPPVTQDTEGLPEMAVGIYDWVVVIDHQEQQAWIASMGRSRDTTRMWPELVALFSRPPRVRRRPGFRQGSPLEANLDAEAYRRCFDRIMDHLEAGECRQITLARRFSASVTGDPWSAYKRLRTLNPAAFGAFLQLPHCAVLCNSPERFLQVNEGQVEASPIGTVRCRATDPVADTMLLRQLLQDSREQAANEALVELLRDDLAACCREDSVRIRERCRLESSAHIHHLVSRIVGELDERYNALDALRICFPGASMTGTPKRRAMEIIEQVEPHRRGICCGAIGYLGGNGHMDLNVAVHTLVHSRGTVRFATGGGLMPGAVADEEYADTEERAGALMQLLALREVSHAGH